MRNVKRVDELFCPAIEQSPHWSRLFWHLVENTILNVVTQKRTIQIGVGVVSQLHLKTQVNKPILTSHIQVSDKQSFIPNGQYVLCLFPVTVVFLLPSTGYQPVAGLISVSSHLFFWVKRDTHILCPKLQSPWSCQGLNHSQNPNHKVLQTIQHTGF